MSEIVISPSVSQVIVSPVGIQGLKGDPSTGGSDPFALKFQQAALTGATAYQETTYSGNLPTVIRTWTDSSKVTLLLTETRTYTGSLVTQIVHVAPANTLTQTLNYTSGLLSSVTSSIATASSPSSLNFSVADNAQYMPLLRYFLGH